MKRFEFYLLVFLRCDETRGIHNYHDMGLSEKYERDFITDTSQYEMELEDILNE